MAKRTGLTGLPAEGINNLSAKSIKSTDALWARVGESLERGSFEEGINWIAQNTQISPAELTNFLADRAMSDTKREGSWLKRHWLDVLVVAGCIILLTLGWRAIGVFPAQSRPLGPGETIIAEPRAFDSEGSRRHLLGISAASCLPLPNCGFPIAI
jgi:hypothetical protein